MSHSEMFCEQCGHFYCSKCSQLRHQKRPNHTIRPLTRKPESGKYLPRYGGNISAQSDRVGECKQGAN